MTAKIEHKVGQAVRVIDVPVATSKHGLFQNIHETNNGADFADSLRDAAAKDYGHAGPLFIQKLIDNYSNLQLSSGLSALQKAFGDNLNAQDARVARSFAIVALAGQLAIKWGILPWKEQSPLTVYG
jgi:putative DNA primase/helicase